MAYSKIKLPASASILILFGFILLSLQLMSSSTQESSELSEMHSWLLVINTLGSITLLILVAVNAYSLVRELKKKEAGSRLTTRMVSLFVLLALAPAAIVFYFSVQFLHQGIDSWFNVEIDRAMDDALELSQSALAQRMNWHIKQTRHIAAQLENKSDTLIALEIGALWADSGAMEIAAFSSQGRILASSSTNPSDILPHLPDEQMWLQLRQNKEYFAFDPGDNDEMMVRVILPIDRDQKRFLQVLYPIPVRVTDLADSIEFAFIRYQEMTFLRNSLKTSFSLILLLVLLLSLLAAIWVAFISIRNIVAPVKELVKGTQAVADGDYKQQLPVMSQDDLGFLVESFNQMTKRIARSRDETRAAGLEVENQRAYLETILANLTAGVISFDADFHIRTANQAAYRILHIPVSHFVSQSLSNLASKHAELADVLEAIQQLLEKADDIWEQRIVFLGPNGRQELLCRGTPLFLQDGSRMGAVVVFDDVTDLIQAQKNAAWGEVARRLAHEIKNPLTPIQLSAERLQHKLSKELPETSQDFLQRGTRTIVQQVEAMKRMVDDFSEYARPSKKQVEKINLIDLIQEILALYVPSGILFSTSFSSRSVIIEADPVSIRQVLHNLIKNAQEATAGNCRIEIKINKAVRNNAEYAELGIYDNGSGLHADQIETIFEPYVTSKAKGTGLGLAIVKKIIEEHGGVIWVDTSYNGGAGFVIQLPVFEFGNSK
ncbi:MAG: ATP-binding protein [Methylomonas sp.]|jgi:nitrogen fixation/metabolism regulation signal transduction histidine kinase|uniref:sensor histidine kinase n=1 Tax=Methylomonas sp. TaxID=418 RepID=UPI0025F984FB|nr:ATP-binding protein [Methylomonas sp.]MCK9606277.1 ATP-binding protein [Methylomonas sp.]